MRNIRQITVNLNDSGQRLDKFLSKSLKNIPASLLYKYIRTKKIKLNGKKCEISEKLAEGDIITLYIREEFFQTKERELSASEKYSSPRLDLKESEIAYEDDNIIIVDKKAGETVHPSLPDEKNGKENSSEIYLIDRIRGYLYKKKAFSPKDENSFSPSLCNRLDRNTGGLIIAAKNAEALRILNKKIKDREIKKTYYCVVSGILPKKKDTLSGYLYKDKSTNKVFVFDSRQKAKSVMRIKYDDDIKSIVTKYEVLSVKDGNSLIEVELITGRTHQIRAHFAHIGHPLLGDGKYGEAKSGSRQYLYSYSVEFCFHTPSGILEYLNGKKICGKGAFFMELFS